MKRSITVLASGAILGAGTVLGPNATQAEAGVYNQPGDHKVNGRFWKTKCEMFSSKVVRCNTQIWATKVVRHNGTYVKHNGWVFNNLTYLPAPRATWGKNPLANTGSWTQGGRQWRTECGTPNTGRNGCRSYILASVLEPNGRGGYKWVKKWTFNNIVQFSGRGVPAVTRIPAAAPKVSGMPVERPVGSSASRSSHRPPVDGSRAQRVVSIAMSKVGSAYRSGATGPNAFDCSGFTSYVYRQVGINLNRSSRAQVANGRPVPKSQLQPGDLVFFYSPISHVGIYIGDGKVVHAGNHRTGVNVIKMSYMPFAKAVRVL